MKKILALVLALCMTACLVACNTGSEGEASDYPTKSIKVIVPWNAGGGNDIAARQLQPIFKEMFDAELVIENVAGGSSAVGLSQAINSDPDG